MFLVFSCIVTSVTAEIQSLSDEFDGVVPTALKMSNLPHSIPPLEIDSC